MSSSVNIAGCGAVVDNPFHRYQMPALSSSFEKRWTVLSLLLRKIADALHQQEEEVLRFIGSHLCTRTVFRQGRACVKGHFTTKLQQETLRECIEVFGFTSKVQKARQGIAIASRTARSRKSATRVLSRHL